MRAFIATVIAGPLALAAVPTLAQSQNPSASQIIKSLMPTGSLAGQTRGIRPAGTVASPPATPSPVQSASSAVPTVAPPPVRQAAANTAPSVSLNVEFPTGSADLTDETRKSLTELGKALSSADLASYRFRIEGHTDTVGSPGYNLKLSQRRAEAVAGFLQSNFGVTPNRLRAIGMGEQGLLVPTPPQTAEERNRRVQVVNLGA